MLDLTDTLVSPLARVARVCMRACALTSDSDFDPERTTANGVIRDA